jgi:hypothetical protein
MTGDSSSVRVGGLAPREKRGKKAAKWRRRRPWLIAGGLSAGGGSGVGLYLLEAHGVIHWQHSVVPAAAAAWAGWVGILAAIVVLVTHLVRLAQERREGQVRIEHERRAGDLMLSKVETFEQAKEAYDRVTDTRADPDGPHREPQGEKQSDPAAPETDQKALTAR